MTKQEMQIKKVFGTEQQLTDTELQELLFDLMEEAQLEIDINGNIPGDLTRQVQQIKYLLGQ